MTWKHINKTSFLRVGWDLCLDFCEIWLELLDLNLHQNTSGWKMLLVIWNENIWNLKRKNILFFRRKNPWKPSSHHQSFSLLFITTWPDHLIEYSLCFSIKTLVEWALTDVRSLSLWAGKSRKVQSSLWGAVAYTVPRPRHHPRGGGHRIRAWKDVGDGRFLYTKSKSSRLHPCSQPLPISLPGFPFPLGKIAGSETWYKVVGGGWGGGHAGRCAVPLMEMDVGSKLSPEQP